MSQCGGCFEDYFSCIAQFYKKNHESLEFLRGHGVLPRGVTCGRCGRACLYREDKHEWRCTGSALLRKTKKRRFCNFAVSDYKGTFMQEVRLPPWKVVLFVNHWLSKNWDHATVIQCLNISQETSVKWRSVCSEVTEDWVIEQDSIGGPGVVVEIGETLIVSRKCDSGGGAQPQIWLFGGIERLSKKHFILPLKGSQGEVERLDRATLVPFIQQYVQAGSVIISDPWSDRPKLGDLGYIHYTVNRSKNFVDLPQSDVHTQNIQHLWKDLKDSVRRPGIKTRFLHQYLSRYLFIKDHVHSMRLHAFFTHAGKLYPHQGDRCRQLPEVPLDDDPE